jgi:hypothetical protein
MLAACEKDKDAATPVNPGTGNNSNTNNGYVDPDALGKWLHGTFAMANYWGYDGSYQGTPFTQSIAFNFTPDGNYEMFYAGHTNNFGCIMDALSYFKGYVVFTDTSFTVHPVQGRFRGYYTCTPALNFDRPAAAHELNVQTFYYTFEIDSNNKRWMVVRFNPNDQFGSYFAETTW